MIKKENSDSQGQSWVLSDNDMHEQSKNMDVMSNAEYSSDLGASVNQSEALAGQNVTEQVVIQIKEEVIDEQSTNPETGQGLVHVNTLPWDAL